MRGTRWIFVAAMVAAAVTVASCAGSGGGNFTSSALVHFLTDTMPDGTTGEYYSVQLEADFPHEGGQFLVVSGTVPPGLGMVERLVNPLLPADPVTNPLAWFLEGYHRRVGNYHFEVAARDGVDRDLPPDRDFTYGEDRRSFNLSVGQGLPNIISTFLPAAQYRASYSAQIDVAGGRAPYTFTDVSVAPDGLPEGLSVSPSGVVGSFPTKGKPTPYSFTVMVEDADGNTDTQALQISVIVKPLGIGTDATLPQAGKDFPYDTTVTLASPGGGAPYTWSQVAPGPGETLLSSLGMELGQDGTGTAHVRNQPALPGPSAEGTFTFTIQVQDVADQVSQRQFTLTIAHFYPILTAITPNRANATGPWTVTGANFTNPCTLTFGQGLPGAVTITPTYVNPQKVTFSTAPGNPGVAGPVTVRVTNSNADFYDKANAFLYPASNLTFDPNGTFISSPVSSFGIDAADANQDGKADVVHCGVSGFQSFTTYTTADGWAQSSASGLYYHRSTSTPGSPSFATQVLDSGNWYDAKFADVNVDGKVDIIALGATNVKTWLNGVSGNPVGTFTAGTSSTLPSGFSYPSTMTVAFLNGDTIPDIAFGVAHYANTTGQVHTMSGDGSGGFSALSSSTSLVNTYGVNAITAINMNGDGKDDLVAGTGLCFSTGPVARYSITTGSSLIGSWTNMPNPSYYYNNNLGVAAGDFLGTGAPAVVCGVTTDPQDGNYRQCTMYTGATLSTATHLVSPSSGDCVKYPIAFDGDFDQKIDIAVSRGNGRQSGNGYSSYLQTCYMNVFRGATLPGVPLVLNTPATAGYTRLGRSCSGDVDGDGRSDILAATSFFMWDYQPMFYSGTYSNRVNGDGTNKGFIVWLNTSN